MDATTVFDPKAWRIVQSFTRRGVIHSQGEPLPADITAEEAEALFMAHSIVRVLEDGSHVFPERPAPATAEEWLRAADVMVLRRIRKYHPDAEMVRAMAADLQNSGRAIQSMVLYEALRAIAGDPLAADEMVL